jgi:hypothetical protein
MADYFPYESVSKSEQQHIIIPAEQLPSEEPVGTLEPVAHFDGAMPTSITVSQKGRIFVNFPKWGDEVPFTVAEVKDGKAARTYNSLIYDDYITMLNVGTLS